MQHPNRNSVRTLEDLLRIVACETTDENRVEALRRVLEDSETSVAFQKTLSAYAPEARVNLLYFFRGGMGYYKAPVNVEELSEQTQRDIANGIGIKRFPVLLACGTSGSYKKFRQTIGSHDLCVGLLPVRETMQ